MKKYLGIIIIAALVLVNRTGVNVRAEGNMSFIMTISQIIDDEVTVAVSIKDIANVMSLDKEALGIMNFQMLIRIDEHLEAVLANETEYFDTSVSSVPGLTDASIGIDTIDKLSYVDDNNYRIYFDAKGSNYLKRDGVLFNIKLRIKDTEVFGIYPLTFPKSSINSMVILRVGTASGTLPAKNIDYTDTNVVFLDNSAIETYVTIKQNGAEVNQVVTAAKPIDIEFKNYTPSSGLSAYIAGYDEEGKLITARIFPLSADNAEGRVDAGIFEPNGYIKVFIWESVMIPLVTGDPLTIGVSH